MPELLRLKRRQKLIQATKHVTNLVVVLRVQVAHSKLVPVKLLLLLWSQVVDRPIPPVRVCLKFIQREFVEILFFGVDLSTKKLEYCSNPLLSVHDSVRHFPFSGGGLLDVNLRDRQIHENRFNQRALLARGPDRFSLKWGFNYQRPLQVSVAKP